MNLSHHFLIRHLSLLILSALAPATCAPLARSVLTTQTQMAPPTLAATRAPTSTIQPPLPTPSIAPPLNATPVPLAPHRAQYTLLVDYDPLSQVSLIKEHIFYPNLNSENLKTLLLLVDSNQKAGVFTLKSLTWGNGQTVSNFHLESFRLDVPLPVPLLSGQAAALDLVYELHLLHAALPLGYTPQQANFINWYPYLPAYLPNQGWMVDPPGAVGEYQSYDLADYDVEIRLENKIDQLIIAASTDGNRIGNGIERFHLLGARNFAWSTSPFYHKLTMRTVTLVGDVNISAYVFPQHLESGQAALTYTAEAIHLFSYQFSPYQHTDFSLVEVDFTDGLESDGIYFLNKNYFSYIYSAGSLLCALSVHETAHQWWFGQVGNNQAREPWLDESLSVYSELLYYQQVRPELVGWWWRNRIKRYRPVGKVNSSIYSFLSFRPYVNAVYLRGALFLDALRNQIGDEAFLAFLKSYIKTYAGQQVSIQDFFSLLKQSSRMDIQPLEDEYFKK